MIILYALKGIVKILGLIMISAFGQVIFPLADIGTGFRYHFNEMFDKRMDELWKDIRK